MTKDKSSFIIKTAKQNQFSGVDISKRRDTMKRDINYKRIGLLIVFGVIFIPIITFLIWCEVHDPQAGLYYNMKKSKLVFKKRN